MSRDFSRGPHVDEGEHLHVAVLMERGLRPYVDFSEHHPPLFWAMLRPLVTETEGVAAMQRLVIRARVMTASFAALAVIAAALIVWRATRSTTTVITYVGVVFAAGGVWWNGLGDVRPDTPALAMWWIGAALILLVRRPTLNGLGLGLICVAAMIKPQWPLSSIVIGCVLLMRVGREMRRLITASCVAAVTAVTGLAATASIADLRTVWFHVITQTTRMIAEILPPGTESPPLFGSPAILRPPTIYLAAALVLLALWRARQAFVDHGLVVTLFALSISSAAEIFWVYPYPAVDFRFYAFWVLAASAIVALVPFSVTALVPERLDRLSQAFRGGVAVLALVVALDIIGPEREADAYWRYAAWLEEMLAPGETIWAGGMRHPIDAHDASYYWFGMHEVIPVAVKLAATEQGRRFLPPIGESDLPPCRVERGLDPKVRFLAKPFEKTPIVRACFDRLVASGRLERTSYPKLWLVRRSPQSPV